MRTKKIRTVIALIPVMLMAAYPASGKEVLLVDSFEDGDNRTELGGWWFAYDDSKVGGNSVVRPAKEFAPTKSNTQQGYAARLRGTTGNKLGWDFFGLGFSVTKDSGCPVSTPVDLSQYSTLEFKIKGYASAGRLTILIPYTDNYCENNIPATRTAWADYQTAVTSDVSDAWTVVTLNLREDFSQPHWTKPEHVVSIEDVLRNAHVIQWQFSSADGDTLDLWIDDVKLY